MKPDAAMTKQEAEEMQKELSKVFSVVRLLGTDMLKTGDTDEPADCQCFTFWKRSHRCENCISRRAFLDKSQKSKLEILDSKIYQVISKYIEIDGTPYIMEMINVLDDDVLIDSDGREELIKKLTGYNKELYTDALTGAYNRRYYEDKLRNKMLPAGVAMIDLDDFKVYNDTFGHNAGDQALDTVVRVIRRHIRKTDMLVRYGGDEFLLVMPGIIENVFDNKLRQIQECIHAEKVPGYDRLKLSVSIGGVLTGSETIESAIHRADQYMYQAKTRKNSVVTEAEGREVLEDTAARDNAHARKSRILIVDDSEMNRAILTEILGEKFDILEAVNGQECVDTLKEYGTSISLILLDIVMPVMDGFEVLDYMNQNEWITDVPVIMISSEDSAVTVRQAYELGVTDYINRPFDAKVVRQRVVNTIKLYAKQRRLITLITSQIYEKEKNNRMMIGILNQILEFRNGESEAHVLNVSAITGLLLERLVQKTDRYNLNWSDRLLIITASALHDIGKTGVDDKILHKKELTRAERNETKKHTLIGASMMNNMGVYKDEDLVKVAYQICRWHHERYDGSGYPDGLTGEQIPIAAQVVGLADAYERLISGEKYGRTFTTEEAIDLILSEKQGAFNPLLLECLSEIETKLKVNIRPDMEVSEDYDLKNKIMEDIQEYENTNSRLMENMSTDVKKEITSVASGELKFPGGGQNRKIYENL